MNQRLINDIVNKQATKDQDLRGRRCINAGNAVNNQDYVTLKDLKDYLNSLPEDDLNYYIKNDQSWNGTSIVHQFAQVFQAAVTFLSDVISSIYKITTAGGLRARFTAYLDAYRADISTNMSYDGSNWNLDDTGSDGTLIHTSATNVFGVWNATAGTNPRTPTLLLKIDSTGGLTLYGKVVKFNNVSTEGYGVGAIVDDVPLTGQTAVIGSTNFTNAGTAGKYIVFYTVEVTTNDSGTPAGILLLNVTYTDGAGSQTRSVQLNLATSGLSINGSVYVELASGNLAYSTSMYSGSIGSAVYALHMTCMRVS